MAEEDDQFLTDQPLKLLSLLPPRRLKTVSFDQQKLLKLFQAVKCTICLEVFSNPVYLKCSHRFCKDCIEKVIRTNQNKSCPNCRGQLSTRRDLRQDYLLTSLMTYTFGDIAKLRQMVSQAQNKLQKTGFSTLPENILQNHKELRDFKSGENNIKGIQQTAKRTRSISHNKEISKDGENLRKRELAFPEQPDEEIKDSSEINKGKNMVIKVDLVKKESSLSERNSHIITVKKKRKEKQVIEIRSSSEDYDRQVQNISNKKQTKIFKVIEEEKPSLLQSAKKKSVIEDNKANQSAQVLENNRGANVNTNNTNKEDKSQNVSQISSRSKRNRKKNSIIQQNDSKQQMTMSLRTRRSAQPLKQPVQLGFQSNKKSKAQNLQKEDKQKDSSQNDEQTADRQVIQAKELLSDFYGSDYMYKLFQQSRDKFLVSIQLQKFPNSYLTPRLSQKTLYISIKSQISDISRVVSNKLNIDNINSIRIFIQKPIESDVTQKTEDTFQFQELHDNRRTILDINKTYWKNYHGIQNFSLKSLQNFLSHPPTRRPWRILYYSINKGTLQKK